MTKKKNKFNKRKNKAIEEYIEYSQTDENISNYSCYIKILFIFFAFFIIYKLNPINKKILKKINKKNEFEIQETNKEKQFEYFCCFCVMGKNENKYARELISYYKDLGVEKFIIGDNNIPGGENFTYILQDYISNGTVDIIDIIGSSISQNKFFTNMYEKYNTKCEWIAFFDFDEYLVMHFNETKNITLREYLSNQIFNNCESIIFNWLMHTDNDLVYYDNRPLMERFTTPNYEHWSNIYLKPIIRGNINKIIFDGKTIHHPSLNLNICDSMGVKIEYLENTLNPPRFKYAFLIHFNTKTAEEYVEKIKKGNLENRPYSDIDGKIEHFFSLNKFSEEKLKLFEMKLNKTFVEFHKD